MMRTTRTSNKRGGGKQETRRQGARAGEIGGSSGSGGSLWGWTS